MQSKVIDAYSIGMEKATVSSGNAICYSFVCVVKVVRGNVFSSGIFGYPAVHF